MAKEFLGKGWSFPVGVDSSTGTIRVSEFQQDIKEAIWIILSTTKGERVMRPEFGCGIHDYVFSSLSTTNIGMMESTVREALVKWEPRIKVLGVSAEQDSSQPGKLVINIEYVIRATNNRYNLVYPFYLNEG